MLAQTLFSAGTFLMVKDVLGDTVNPGQITGMQLMTLRYAAAAAILAALLFTLPSVREILRGRVAIFLWLGFLAVPFNVALFFEGASRAPAAHAALAYALTPVFVFAIERVLGRGAPTPRRILGLALALAGALVVVASRGKLTGPEPVGDLMLLGAAFSWALYTVGSRPVVAAVGSRATMVLSLLAGSILWIPFAIPILAGTPIAQLTLWTWTGVAYTAIITTVVSYSLWLFALKRLEPTQVAVFTNLQPVATVALAWLILGEPIRMPILIATALILGGVALVQR
jgi:drug/metabolite transporter (DMT)-like permease